ncbi:helix-turn-helix domain-containing protein [Marinibaculum pumilum]|uniref:Helix-turn-helix domain-containing protein n=1 Tax=Marinibaculum pumilum TaxID=1766165 RepID=A0ABV7L2P2_9PROT
MDDQLRYDYAGDSRVLEGADWIGCRPAGLRLHYHAETQLSVVWNGCRDYCIGAHRLRLAPGHILAIGGLVAHRALPTQGRQVISAEFYLPPDSLPDGLADRLARSAYLLAAAPALLDIAPGAVGDLVAGGLSRHAPRWTGPARPVARAPGGTGGGAAAARLSGLSREGFIRAFARQFGMTPHAYDLNARLNAGRQMLRDGARISEAAYAAGFCDQSHFGRMFLAFFGATPGRFRAAHHPD